MRMLLLWFVIVLAGCDTVAPRPGNPLLTVACPDLMPPIDDSFGATTIALVKTSEQYYKCRAANLQTKK